jgi:hypothetical protein
MDEDVFLVFGLAFFLFVIWMIVKDSRITEDRRDRREDIAYNRRLAEAREFGFEGKKHDARTLNDHWKQ